MRRIIRHFHTCLARLHLMMLVSPTLQDPQGVCCCPAGVAKPCSFPQQFRGICHMRSISAVKCTAGHVLMDIEVSDAKMNDCSTWTGPSFLCCERDCACLPSRGKIFLGKFSSIKQLSSQCWLCMPVTMAMANRSYLLGFKVPFISDSDIRGNQPSCHHP